MGIACAAITPPVILHDLTLAWDAVPEAGIQGYKVYLGLQSGDYQQILDAGIDAALTIRDLEFGKTYYFAVSAIGSTGIESPLSAELVVSISLPPLPPSAEMFQDALGRPTLQWSYPESALASFPEFIIQSSQDLVTWSECDRVYPEESIGSDAGNLRFSWPVEVTTGRMFFRLTAGNWLGESSGP